MKKPFQPDKKRHSDRLCDCNDRTTQLRAILSMLQVKSSNKCITWGSWLSQVFNANTFCHYKQEETSPPDKLQLENCTKNAFILDNCSINMVQLEHSLSWSFYVETTRTEIKCQFMQMSHLQQVAHSCVVVWVLFVYVWMKPSSDCGSEYPIYCQVLLSKGCITVKWHTFLNSPVALLFPFTYLVITST